MRAFLSVLFSFVFVFIACGRDEDHVPDPCDCACVECTDHECEGCECGCDCCIDIDERTGHDDSTGGGCDDACPAP